MQSDADRRITRFVEKPKDRSVLDELKLERELLDIDRTRPGGRALSGLDGHLRFQSARCWSNASTTTWIDFGKHIIPHAIKSGTCQRLHFQGLLGGHRDHSRLFRGQSRPDRSRAAIQFLRRDGADLHAPALSSREARSTARRLRQAIISDGCIISDAHIERQRHRRAQHHPNAAPRFGNSIVMGARLLRGDPASRPADVPPLGIGRNCVIDRAIIDKNARIGDGVVITPEGKAEDLDAAQSTSSATASWWCRRTRSFPRAFGFSHAPGTSAFCPNEQWPPRSPQANER